jgi:hypothetical protein
LPETHILCYTVHVGAGTSFRLIVVAIQSYPICPSPALFFLPLSNIYCSPTFLFQGDTKFILDKTIHILYTRNRNVTIWRCGRWEYPSRM